MTLLAGVVLLGAVHVEALAHEPRTDRPAAEGPGAVAHLEPRSALPTFIWGEDGPSLRPLTPEQAARRHLWTYAPRYRVQPAELSAAPLGGVHDTGSGAIIVSFRRPDVFRETLSVVMDRELRAVALTGYLSPGPLPSRDDARLTLATAVSVAVQHATGRWVELALQPLAERGRWTRYAAAEHAGLTGAWRARPLFYALPGRFEPAWDLELTVDAEPYRAVISSRDGRVLHFSSQRSEAAHGYRVFADGVAPFTPWEGPTGTAALPHPTALPDAFSPAYVAPQVVTLDHAGLPTMDPWLPAGATALDGNNAIAYADRTAPDGLFLADGGATSDTPAPTSSAGAFDWAYDLTREPNATASQRNASATHAFYVVNWLHDVFYPLGFDEPSGVAQASSYGRGGLEGDPLLVEVQDYRGMNNAAMTCPADGESPRLELFPFRDDSPAIVQVSGSLDAGYVVGTSYGPAVYDVSGPLVVGRAADGGTDGCRGPFMNAAQTSGAVVLLSNNGGRCQPQAQLDNATDAGAVGVVLTTTGNFYTNYVGLGPTARPTVNMRAPDSAALMSLLGSGGSLNARLVREALPDRDSALDTSIVVHEWAHYLSQRLIGDGAGLETTVGGALGEGYSDFAALLVLIQPSDAAVATNAMWRGAWSIGAFALAPPTLPDGIWYYGFRRFPYSIDRAKNDLTFRHVQDNEPLPTTPQKGGQVGPNSSVHNSGEVWATALLELYASLLSDARLPFAEAQRRMRGYLVAALKATPPNPSFLEARDALIAVAQASDPADRVAFIQAFARRGFGPSATGPDRFAADGRPVVEDFTDTVTQARIASVTLDDGAGALFCDKDSVLDVGEQAEVVVRLFNHGTTPLPASTGIVTSPTAGVSLPGGGALSFAAVQPFAVVTARAPIAYAGPRGPVRLELRATAMNPMLATSPSLLVSMVADYDEVPSDTETFEADARGWTPLWESPVARLGYEQAFRLRRTLVTDTVLWGPIPRQAAATYFTSPTLVVGTTDPLRIRFRHRYQFRAGGADGALLLISPDDGVTWDRVVASAMTPAYPGTLLNGGSNPLRGGNAPAWTGASPSYPTLQQQDVDLGLAYAGKRIKISFALGVDNGATGNGWELDNVRITGLAPGFETPFVDEGPEGGACLNRPPVARAGADFAADERTMVRLDASASTDADGQTLSFGWTQTGGPAVTLAADAFVAPEVTADTALTFQLTASDGTAMATDDVVVTVRNVNRPPAVTVDAPASVDEGAELRLVATGVDPDGDALTYAWTQTSGPAVTLAAGATQTFSAPAGQLGFSVTVSDGVETSAPATVSVNVVPKPPETKKGCGCGATEGLLGLVGVLALRRRRRS